MTREKLFSDFSLPNKKILLILHLSFREIVRYLCFSCSPFRSGDEVVIYPPLNRKVECPRPTMIRARCLISEATLPSPEKGPK